MNLVLHGVEDFLIASGKSTLSDPAFLNGDQLSTFNVILANPPYSISAWNREAWSNDPYGRNTLGTPPQGRADYAFFQHILASLDKSNGRVQLFPHGVAFKSEHHAGTYRNDLIECVLGLGPGLFYNSPMEACVIICRTNKPKSRKNKILFINASHEIAREQGISFLKPEHQKRILAAYENFTNEDGFSQIAPTQDILDKDSSLSIPLYVDAASPSEKELKTFAQIWDSYKETNQVLQSQIKETQKVLNRIAKKVNKSG